MKKLLLGIVVLAVCGVKMYGQNNTKSHPSEPEMVFVEGGTFQMGCTAEQGKDCRDNEKPAHSVTVSSFNIGKYEVTQKQWKTLMGDIPPEYSKGDNYPIETVYWENTQKFISLLNAATGKNYRLPTEAEWEYAARGGTKSKGYKYSGSNKLSDVAWYDKGGYKLQPVGTKQPNELGIYDMSGNVWELCSDLPSDYSASSQHDPQVTTSSQSSRRVDRGGCWVSDSNQCRITYRSSSPYNMHFGKGTGFRLVLPHDAE